MRATHPTSRPRRESHRPWEAVGLPSQGQAAPTPSRPSTAAWAPPRGTVTLRKTITGPSLRLRKRGKPAAPTAPQTDPGEARPLLRLPHAGAFGVRGPAMPAGRLRGLPWGWPTRCHAPGRWGRLGTGGARGQHVLGGRESRAFCKEPAGPGEMLNHLKASLSLPGGRCEPQNLLE